MKPTELQCSQCQEHWMHTGEEKTLEERRKWICPRCQELELRKIRSDEAKLDEIESEKEIK